jgi:AcrR family transcriptional regulator
MVYRKTAASAARKLARRKLLLEAATRHFGSHGYHAATVPMIVAEAGSSVGSFYAHFRNKEDAFAAVLQALGRKMADVLQQARESQTDPLKRIPTAIESLFLYLVENPIEARILIVESSGLSPRLEKVRRGILREQAEQVCHALEAAPDAFYVADPAIAANCLVGAVFESLCSWLEVKPADRRPAAEIVRAVVDYNCRALRRR